MPATRRLLPAPPQGCRIQNYLLEKSRVVRQAAEERNYHIFYMLIKGLSDADRRLLAITGCPTKYK